MGPEEYLSPEKCRANARECYDAARKITDPEARHELLYPRRPSGQKLADMIAADRCKLIRPERTRGRCRAEWNSAR